MNSKSLESTCTQALQATEACAKDLRIQDLIDDILALSWITDVLRHHRLTEHPSIHYLADAVIHCTGTRSLSL